MSNEYYQVQVSKESYVFLINLLNTLLQANEDEAVDIDDKALTDVLVELSSYVG